MKKTQLCRPVLIETAEASNLYLHNNMLYNFEAVEHTPGQDNGSNQYLVLVSLDPESKIVDGDFYIKKHGNGFGNYISNAPIEWCHKSKYSKVVATHNQLPLKYIKKVVKEYNFYSELKDVEIEVECKNIQPKLTNGFVTIIEEATYTKKDLEDAWRAGYDKAVSSINEDDNAPDYNTWFNNNKKK